MLRMLCACVCFIFRFEVFQLSPRLFEKRLSHIFSRPFSFLCLIVFANQTFGKKTFLLNSFHEKAYWKGVIAHITVCSRPLEKQGKGGRLAIVQTQSNSTTASQSVACSNTLYVWLCFFLSERNTHKHMHDLRVQTWSFLFESFLVGVRKRKKRKY